LCDKGLIELVKSDWLDPVAEILEKTFENSIEIQ
jgi:hypothetical protein